MKKIKTKDPDKLRRQLLIAIEALEHRLARAYAVKEADEIEEEIIKLNNQLKNLK
jgi:hypothetical protein